MNAGGAPLLAVEGLRVTVGGPERDRALIDGVGFELRRGATLGLVGESGAGKTLIALALLGLTGPGTRVSGRALLDGEDLLALDADGRRAVRGRRIGMVFQDPLGALHPLRRVGTQVAEALRAHRLVPRERINVRAQELLERVGLADARRAYPSQLSGGMRQRVMLAMALANEPDLLIADEPTSALDVTLQAQVLALMAELQSELGMAVLLISHDLGVVAGTADEVAVMYAGRVVECAPARVLFAEPAHPYTWGLLGSLPAVHGPRPPRLATIPGAPPSPGNPPAGCRFHPRCAFVAERHRHVEPALGGDGLRAGHMAACLLAPDVRRRLWELLRDGATPEEARTTAGLSGPAS